MSKAASGIATGRWIYSSAAVAPAGKCAARQFLARRDETELRLFALLYGYGLDVGLAAWTLDLDAALAHWRLRAALSDDGGAAGGPGPEALERGVAALLSQDGGPSDDARRIAAELPAEARGRLQAALDGTRVAAASERARPGLGVGSLVIVVLAIAGFLFYGVLRDLNPLRHGKTLMRLGDFVNARLAFEELGGLPEARAWSAIAWLAEGNYARALEALQAPGAASHLAMFRPMDEPLETIEVDPSSLVMLPRGLISTPFPILVYRAGAAGEIVLLGRPFEGAAENYRPLRLKVPDTSAGPDAVIALSWPADLGPLAAGDYTWTVPGSERHPATFTLLPDEQRHEIERRVADKLSDEVPYQAGTFLRAHYFLRNRLYMQAGQAFAYLARRFPDEAYPREMVAQVAAALGVDPSAFLR